MIFVKASCSVFFDVRTGTHASIVLTRRMCPLSHVIHLCDYIKSARSNWSDTHKISVIITIRDTENSDNETISLWRLHRIRPTVNWKLCVIGSECGFFSSLKTWNMYNFVLKRKLNSQQKSVKCERHLCKRLLSQFSGASGKTNMEFSVSAANM